MVTFRCLSGARNHHPFEFSQNTLSQRKAQPSPSRFRQFYSGFLPGKTIEEYLYAKKSHVRKISADSIYFFINSIRFLVNTSGSGKTRLLLEGLCVNWGFYFTSLVDSSLLGSSDVQNSIQTHVPDSSSFRRVLPLSSSSGYEAALITNREIASRIFRQIFLARLMIFNLFAETMINDVKTKSELDVVDSHVYKARWLLLQLQPSFVHPQVWDVFDELSCKLSNASDSYINTTTKMLLSTVRSHLSVVDHPGDLITVSQMSTAETAQTPLFCVLDEAQYAATQHNSSFRSDQNGSHRPILREIVKAWEGQSFGQGVFMIVAGTGISKDVVDQAMASAIMKDSRYRWCSDTGAFDFQHVQTNYLRKYLPPNLLQTEAGVRLLERVWYWLHGRYDLLFSCRLNHWKIDKEFFLDIALQLAMSLNFYSMVSKGLMDYSTHTLNTLQVSTSPMLRHLLKRKVPMRYPYFRSTSLIFQS